MNIILSILTNNNSYSVYKPFYLTKFAVGDIYE